MIIYSDDENNDIHTVRIIIPKIALLDIESENTKNITLKLISPEEAGDPLLSATDERIWLNVTSIVESGNARDITVKIDEPMDGVDLRVVSDPYTGTGYGAWGSPHPLITLSTEDQTLVSGIKSGKTGDGAFNGFNIKYLAESTNSDFDRIKSTKGKAISVTYTLTQ